MSSNNKEKRSALISQANALVNKVGAYTKEDNARVESLLRLAEALDVTEELVTDEQRKSQERTELFRYLKTGAIERTYVPMSDSVQGVFVVPNEFYGKLLTGIAQYTELMNQDNVNLIETTGGGSLKMPQLDLQTISSAIASENTDVVPVSNPVISAINMTLGGYTYVTTPVAASLALEQDSFMPVLDLLSQAFSVGLARGIGADLVNGSGSGAPEGVLTAAANSGITSAGSTFTKAELQSIYFSVNRAYRISPKAAWLMHDDTYNAILGLKDATTNRPLVSITEDGEKLFGKRILISPDMPTQAGSRSIVFGDLGQYCVRVVRSSASVKRNFQAAGYAEKALGLYTSFLRVDASLNAPNGAQPVVYGTLHP